MRVSLSLANSCIVLLGGEAFGVLDGSIGTLGDEKVEEVGIVVESRIVQGGLAQVGE